MGDPTMRLAVSAGYATIDSINGEPVDSVADSPLRAVQLNALSTVTVNGTVRDAGQQARCGISPAVSPCW